MWQRREIGPGRRRRRRLPPGVGGGGRRSRRWRRGRSRRRRRQRLRRVHAEHVLFDGLFDPAAELGPLERLHQTAERRLPTQGGGGGGHGRSVAVRDGQERSAPSADTGDTTGQWRPEGSASASVSVRGGAMGTGNRRRHKGRETTRKYRSMFSFGLSSHETHVRIHTA